jgi:hypothetical protein
VQRISLTDLGVKIGDFGWSFLPFNRWLFLEVVKSKNGGLRLTVNCNRTQNVIGLIELFRLTGAQYALPTRREGLLDVTFDQSIEAQIKLSLLYKDDA